VRAGVCVWRIEGKKVRVGTIPKSILKGEGRGGGGGGGEGLLLERACGMFKPK
jgi:hypothetical protein